MVRRTRQRQPSLCAVAVVAVASISGELLSLNKDMGSAECYPMGTVWVGFRHV